MNVEFKQQCDARKRVTATMEIGNSHDAIYVAERLFEAMAPFALADSGRVIDIEKNWVSPFDLRHRNEAVIGEGAPSVLDWPFGATHHLEDIDGAMPSFFARLDGNHYRDVAGEGSVFVEHADPCGWKVTTRPDAPEQVWGTRRDGDWSHDSLADLIKENTEHDGTCSIQPGTIVWRGLKKFDDPEDFVPGADDIINDMANNAAASDAGEWADDYPNVTEEAQAELNDFLIAWARKHAPVEKFYCVDAIEQYTVTAEDLAR